MFYKVCFLILVILSTADAEMRWQEDVLIGAVHTVVTEWSRTWEPGNEIERAVRIYDNKGREIESQHSTYKVGGSSKDEEKGVKYIHSYNPKTNEEKITSFSPDGSLSQMTIISYDARGEVKENKIYHSDGSLRFRWVFTYDTEGRKIESKYYKYHKAEETLTSHIKTVYKVDANGRTISISTRKERFKPGIPGDYTDITTFEQGKEVERTILKDGSFDMKIVMSYDEKGALIESQIHSQDGSLQSKQSYVYEFDSIGNWIRKTTRRWVSKEGKLEMESPDIVKRTITYY